VLLTPSSDLSLPEKQPKTKQGNIINEVNDMLPEYDFTNAVKNPYAKKLKKQITINLDCDTIDYFKEQSDQSGIPYQTLINLYLADCVLNKKKLHMTWN
jgi:predicted DNA binding CopG/RHH family protein